MGARGRGPDGQRASGRDELRRRRRELADIKNLVSAHRLVTLTGVGGVGKTRLALRFAEEIRSSFEDGAWVVELGSVQDGGLLTQTVAAALGLREQSTRSLDAQLAEHLAHRRMLIILDNCEHLLGHCASFADGLLHTADQLRLLATSRTTLGIGGEHLFTVPPLPVPLCYGDSGQGDSGHGPTPASEAVELLVDRARVVQPGFTVTEENGDAVVALCTRLDGLPLAIELAATRLRSLGVEQVVERLADRFRLLTGGSRVALPRQQTLRALIDWSYDLCSPEEQLLWTRLSVFTGGFDLCAAEHVCAGADLPPEHVLDRVSHLVAQSILLTEQRAGRVHYRMLETIQEYGRERLGESGEEGRLRQRHRDHYLDLVERITAQWCGPEQADGLRRLRAEQDNLRAALDWSASERDGAPRCSGSPQLCATTGLSAGSSAKAAAGWTTRWPCPPTPLPSGPGRCGCAPRSACCKETKRPP